MSDTKITSENGGSGEVFAIETSNGRGARSDARMVAQAIRGKWNVSDETKAKTLKRMLAVIERPPAVNPETGELYPGADNAAVAAARVLVMADQVDQTDYWNADKNDRLDKGLATERLGVGDIVSRRPIAAVNDPTAPELPTGEAGNT